MSLDDVPDRAADAPMRWDGWGDPARAKGMSAGLRLLLTARLGHVPRRLAAVAPADVTLAASRLTEEDLAALRDAVGPENLRDDHGSRLRHAGGKSTPDLLRRRQATQAAPDAVVTPAHADEIAAVLRVATERDLAVVPFGGGTAVTGGLAPDAGQHRAVVSLDLSRLSGLVALDEVSGEASFLAGTRATDAEAALAERGWELGHYPQSFRHATLGGFAVMRSSGQSSAGYGRFETMVTGLSVVTPTGALDLGRAPGSAAGPDLIRLFLGSEGVLGVVTQVRVRVHRLPEARLFDTWTFPDFATGTAALREVAQLGTGPTVLRLSDEAETAVGLAQHGHLGRALTKGCSAVVLHEGPAALAAERRARTAAVLEAAGGRRGAEEPAVSWDRGRFDAPYLRDTLLDHGVFCETLETATTWSNLPALREAVTGALADGFGTPKNVVLCHVSHVYPTGASLYFTVVGDLGRDPADALERWAAIKARVNDAIMETGGTISHHHGVGADHAAWLEREIGPVGARILRAVKAELDPAGVLNPGVLIPVR